MGRGLCPSPGTLAGQAVMGGPGAGMGQNTCLEARSWGPSTFSNPGFHWYQLGRSRMRAARATVVTSLLPLHPGKPQEAPDPAQTPPPPGSSPTHSHPCRAPISPHSSVACSLACAWDVGPMSVPPISPWPGPRPAHTKHPLDPGGRKKGLLPKSLPSPPLGTFTGTLPHSQEDTRLPGQTLFYCSLVLLLGASVFSSAKWAEQEHLLP